LTAGLIINATEILTFEILSFVTYAELSISP